MRTMKTVTVCDRCSFGGERPGTEIRSFAVEDRWYRLELCREHAGAFDRDLAPWIQLAAETDSPEHAQRHKSEYFTAERRAETRRLTEVLGRVKHQAAADDLAARRSAPPALSAEHRESHQARQTEYLELHAFQSIPGAKKWHIGAHARQRMAERDLGFTDVLLTATAPHVLVMQPWRGDGIAVYQRDRCRLVVDVHRHKIVTVIDRDKELETGPSGITPKLIDATQLDARRAGATGAPAIPTERHAAQ